MCPSHKPLHALTHVHVHTHAHACRIALQENPSAVHTTKLLFFSTHCTTLVPLHYDLPTIYNVLRSVSLQTNTQQLPQTLRENIFKGKSHSTLHHRITPLEKQVSANETTEEVVYAWHKSSFSTVHLRTFVGKGGVSDLKRKKGKLEGGQVSCRNVISMGVKDWWSY